MSRHHMGAHNLETHHKYMCGKCNFGARYPKDLKRHGLTHGIFDDKSGLRYRVSAEQVLTSVANKC
jgi:hypothetical protein